MILAKSYFCKDFDKCITLYKDFLEQSNSTPSETRRVSEVSYGVRGGIFGQKVEYHYYTKDEYSKISCE